MMSDDTYIWCYMVQPTMTCALVIRPARLADRPALRRAIVELQDYERRHHDTRLPGEAIADRYLDWMWRRAADDGIVLVADIAGSFAGFVAGWVEQATNVAETAESNRFGLVSDICVMPDFRGHRLAERLLCALEQHLRATGIARLRVSVLAANASARRSYEHAGFSAYEVVYEKLMGTHDDE
jgi:ribosomal protein S18 acetylase RimI-like enzyme